MRALASIVLGVLGFGCSLFDDLERHASRQRPNATAARAIDAARESLIDADYASAEASLRAAIEADREAVQAWRWLQDLQIATGRRGEALREAMAEHEHDPTSARACYLVARVREGTARRRWLDRALDRDPWYGWAELALAGLAESTEGPGAGLQAADRARRLLPNEPEPWLALARSAAAAGQPKMARLALRTGEQKFSRREPAFTAMRLRLALAEADAGAEASVAAELEDVEDRLSALLLDPSGTLVLAAVVRSGVPGAQRDRIEDALAEARRRPKRTPRLAACHAWLGAALASSGGRGDLARSELEKTSDAELGSQTTFELRLARVRGRDYAGAVAIYAEWLEPFLPALGEDAAHRLDALREASARASASPRDPQALLTFARAAASVGWIEEALAASAHAEAAGGGEAAASFLREIDGFRLFAAGMSRALSTALRGSGATPPTDALLEAIRDIGKRDLGYDPVEGTRVDTYFPVGTLVDTAPTSPGLGRTFDRYGLEMKLGRRFFGPVEAYLLRRVAARPLDGRVLGRPFEGREVLGEGTSRLTRLEATGSRIAGATLPGGLFLALDAIADEAGSLEALGARRLSTDAAAATAELPIAQDDVERLAADEPFDVESRLVARALAREPGPLDARTLEIVRLHELGHLADVREYLPVLAHAPSLLSWLLSSGFSFDAIEARLERRAELTALACTRDPDLALARIVDAGSAPAAHPPHSAGFAVLLADLVAEVDRRLDALPAIDRRRAILPQLWKLSPEQIHDVAWTLAKREGLVEGDGASPDAALSAAHVVGSASPSADK